MFGIYRAILALSVAAAHLGYISTGAHYAVFGFFILSGYLMTFIMHRTYGYTAVGCLRYLLNRALRIFPPYWMAVLISAALVIRLGHETSVAFHPSIYWPDTPKELLQNVFLAFNYTSSPRLVPPAWALSVELFFYLCIGLGASRTKKGALWWFLLSVVYTVVMNVFKASFDARYYLIPSASLPFSTGAFIYHFRDAILRRLSILTREQSPLILLGLLYATLRFALKWNGYYTWGYYLAYLLNALLVLSLLDRKSLAGISRKADAIAGDFSYPLYLLHYPAGLLLLAAGFTAAKRGQALFFYAALPILWVLAWVMARFVDRPVEMIRQRMKAGSSSQDTPNLRNRGDFHSAKS